MKEIPLTKGLVALVDDDDYNCLIQWCWCAYKGPRGTQFYAKRSQNGFTVLMHRQIMNAPQGCEVDHIDGRGLNNQRHNLRLATHAGNSANCPRRRNNQSGYKGVTWDALGKKWSAHITAQKKSIYLGLFQTKIEAAKAYDRAAIQHFGAFACTNAKLGLLT